MIRIAIGMYLHTLVALREGTPEEKGYHTIRTIVITSHDTEYINPIGGLLQLIRHQPSNKVDL